MTHLALIDDEPLVRESLEALLESQDWTTECFGSSEDFLLSGNQGHYDCLLVDFRLPGMNGSQLIKDLRARDVATPAILLSGNIDSNIVDHLRGLQAVMTLSKPCRAQELFDAVSCCLRSVSC